MSGERFDLVVGVEAAWVGFRSRLADHLAELEEDDSVVIEVPSGVAEEELDGTAPYLNLIALETDIYAELAGNDCVDERYALGDAEEETLLDIGWEEPDEPGEEFTAVVERREADRLAVMTVRALREVYGVQHPAFLAAEGLEVDPEQRPSAATPVVPEQPEEEQVLEAVVFVSDPDELQEEVDRTVAAELGLDEVQHDDDGDIAVRAGDTLVWIAVSRARPVVRVSAAVAVDVEDVERLPTEVEILNERHPFARFTVRDRRVDLDYVLPAAPFSPPQLQAILRQVLQDVDSRGRDLIRRVGGRMLLDAPADGVAVPPSPETEPGLVSLLEVMHVRAMTSAGVAELFDQDRRAIVRAIVGLRTGRIECAEHDLEDVLEHLRRGLSHIAYREGRDQGRRRARPPRPRTQQLSLLPDGDTLDEGQWEQDIS